MRTRTPPIRTCTGCGATSDKREMVRFVRTADGDVLLDPTGKANGRGAYTCLRSECFESAVSKRRLAAALRVTLREEDTDRLRDQLDRLLEPAGSACAKDGDA